MFTIALTLLSLLICLLVGFLAGKQWTQDSIIDCIANDWAYEIGNNRYVLVQEDNWKETELHALANRASRKAAYLGIKTEAN